jgi:hypothetical protein
MLTSSSSPSPPPPSPPPSSPSSPSSLEDLVAREIFYVPEEGRLLFSGTLLWLVPLVDVHH